MVMKRDSVGLDVANDEDGASFHSLHDRMPRSIPTLTIAWLPLPPRGVPSSTLRSLVVVVP